LAVAQRACAPLHALRAARSRRMRTRRARLTRFRSGIEAKQPNSAVRKCVRVQLKKNNKRITCFVPRDGGMTFIDENDEVLIAGFGRSGHAVGDLPGVRFQVVKVAGVSLYALWLKKKEKPIK